MRILANGSRLRMQFPDGWIDAHPLTLEDLESQAAYLREAGFELVLS